MREVPNIIFESTVEEKLIKPTFIYNYPVEISPLARSLDKDYSTVERFELFVNGKELGNSFSELNDPEEQANRFELQVKEKEAGDEEAMQFDKDYIEALEYGLAPCAGVGIGIERFFSAINLEISATTPGSSLTISLRYLGVLNSSKLSI